MLKDTPPIESPTVTLPRQQYNEVMEMMKKYDLLQSELLKAVNDFNELKMTTISFVLPNGDYIDFRSNNNNAHVLMDGLFLVLKHDRYKHIYNDLFKIGSGQK